MVEESIEEQWKKVKERVATTCKEVICLQKQSHKKWLTKVILEKIANRKWREPVAQRHCAQETYTTAKRRVETSIKADIRNYVNDLYNTIKKLAGTYSKSEKPVKNKEGRTIEGSDVQKNRWKGYFEISNGLNIQDDFSVQNNI